MTATIATTDATGKPANIAATTDATGKPANIASLAGYLSMAGAAERVGNTPWEVRKLLESGHLESVEFNGRRHVAATDVDALA